MFNKISKVQTGARLVLAVSEFIVFVSVCTVHAASPYPYVLFTALFVLLAQIYLVGSQIGGRHLVRSSAFITLDVLDALFCFASFVVACIFAPTGVYDYGDFYGSGRSSAVAGCVLAFSLLGWLSASVCLMCTLSAAGAVPESRFSRVFGHEHRFGTGAAARGGSKLEPNTVTMSEVPGGPGVPVGAQPGEVRSEV